ncbi:MAG: tRNA pseudouridine(38-40) synthase TruA, partial [Chlorobiaceae bacterium]|nr:tRNA pseudouridine(38-40) synthase TruA [Chlorobiaceae bacterium]
MRNIRLTVEYDGTDFAGWQRQNGRIATVQGEIEDVLRKILQEPVSLSAAGRTDRGVHARAQIANFSTASSMELSRMVHSLNSMLPGTIRVSDPLEVPGDFHARFSAKEREYRYFLIEYPSAIYGRFSGCSNGKVNLEIMGEIASAIEGVHDFTAFSRPDRDNEGRICTVSLCSWRPLNSSLVLQITANRFLRSMVRYLVAAMISAGKGLLSPAEFRKMLEAGVFTGSLKPALPNGLFLWEIT